MKKIIFIILIIAMAVASGIFLKNQKKEVAELPVAKKFTYNVDLVEAKIKNVKESRHFLGQVLASNSALIASKYMAEIKKIYVKENDIVTKGKLLIVLDDSEIRTNIASQKKQRDALIIDVKSAKDSLQRSKKLLEIEAISQEKYDTANVVYQNKLAVLSGAEERLKQLAGQLKYLNIKAPFSGRIGTIFVDEGNLAAPAKPIISLNSDDQKLIFSYVSSSQSIMEGQKVLIDGVEVGVIKHSYDDAKNALLVAEVKLSKALPYVNKAYVNIDVVIAETKGCSIPLNALLHRKEGVFVMIYKESSFEPLEVEVLLQNTQDAILKECPNYPMATASEAKLALLPSYGSVLLSGEH